MSETVPENQQQKRRSGRKKQPTSEQINLAALVGSKKKSSSKSVQKESPADMPTDPYLLDVMRALKDSLQQVNSRMDSFEATQKQQLVLQQQREGPKKPAKEERKKRKKKTSPATDSDSEAASSDSSSSSSSSGSSSSSSNSSSSGTDGSNTQSKKSRSKVKALCSTFKVPEKDSTRATRELFLLKKGTDLSQLQVSRNRHEGDHILQVAEILLRGPLTSTVRHALATLSARAQQLVLMEKRNPDFANEWGKSIALQTQDQDDILARANRFGLMAESRKRQAKSSPPPKKRGKHPTSRGHVKKEEKVKPATN
jgi:hypothetical protein